MNFYNEKMIFPKTFQIANRELKAVEVPQSCSVGSLLENIKFEVSDVDGLIDESIDGPLHTLSMMSDELKLDGPQYDFDHGKCVISHVPVPNEPGTFSLMAYHTHYPDLNTKIQIQVYALDSVPIKLEDGTEPILSHLDISVPTNQLASAQPNNLDLYVKEIIERICDKIRVIGLMVGSEERKIEIYDSQMKSLTDDILNLKVKIGPAFESFLSANELTRLQIKESIGTAAAVLCDISNGDVVGIIALLGSFVDRRVSRMVSAYLGEDNMLAVVCKKRATADNIEKYDSDGNIDGHLGTHHIAAALGAPINKRFPVICLDSILPYTGGIVGNSPQKELLLYSRNPKGFVGFAVNMINLSAENLNITTGFGRGLRETLFYRLLGELQVYETRNDMMQALPYLKDGAVSLDGGIVKGNGIFLLGSSDPSVTFPVTSVNPNIFQLSRGFPDVVKNAKLMVQKARLLKIIEGQRKVSEDKRQKLIEKFHKKKQKFYGMSERISQL